MAMTKEERQAKLRELEQKIASKKGIGAVYGLVKGWGLERARHAMPAQKPVERPAE